MSNTKLTRKEELQNLLWENEEAYELVHDELIANGKSKKVRKELVQQLSILESERNELLKETMLLDKGWELPPFMQ